MHKCAIGNIFLSIKAHISIFSAQLTMPFVPYFPIRIVLFPAFIKSICPQIIMGINLRRYANHYATALQ